MFYSRMMTISMNMYSIGLAYWLEAVNGNK